MCLSVPRLVVFLNKYSKYCNVRFDEGLMIVFNRPFSFHMSTSVLQLADLNRRLPAEAGLPAPKPGPLRTREVPPPPRPSPHTITLQTPAFRNLRLPKRLRVVYFLARTRLAQRIIMVRKLQRRLGPVPVSVFAFGCREFKKDSELMLFPLQG